MTELTWARNALQNHVAPIGSAQTVKARIRLSARRLKWKFSRVAAVWYADERVSMKPRELRQIEEITGLEYGRQELRAVEDLISNADALLMGNDPDFYGAFVAGMRAFASAFHSARASRGDE
jgi:hypothetical protein